MASRGRKAFTRSQVYEIRNYQPPDSIRSLATRFGVAPRTIMRIVSGVTYSDLPMRVRPFKGHQNGGRSA